MTSTNEGLEEYTRQWAYPDARRLNTAQKGADWVRDTYVGVRYETHKATKTQVIVEVHTGGEWIQNKRLLNTATPDNVDVIKTGIYRGIREAYQKLDSQVKLPEYKTRENTPHPSAPERTGYELYDPEKFEVRIEVEGFDNLPTPIQDELQQYANEQNDAWAAGSEIAGKPQRTVVREPPPPDFKLKPDGQRPPAGTAVGTITPEMAARRKALGTAADAAGKEAVEAEIGARYAVARDIVEKGGKPPPGFKKIGNIFFMLVVVGEGIYVYSQAPDEKKAQALTDLGKGVAAELAVGYALVALTDFLKVGAAGGPAGFALTLDGDQPPKSDERKQAESIVNRQWPDLQEKDELEYERRVKQAESLVEDGNAVAFSQNKQEKKRQFEPERRSLETTSARGRAWIRPLSAKPSATSDNAAIAAAQRNAQASSGMAASIARMVNGMAQAVAQRSAERASRHPGQHAAHDAGKHAAHQAVAQANAQTAQQAALLAAQQAAQLANFGGRPPAPMPMAAPQQVPLSVPGSVPTAVQLPQSFMWVGPISINGQTNPTILGPFFGP